MTQFRLFAGLALLSALCVPACKKSTAAADTKFFPLNDTESVKTDEGRKFMRYLASCALPTGIGAYAELDGKRHEFPGSMGLAPEWSKRALNEDEQQLVSACILARTNLFGVTVQISMRGEGADALRASAEEKRDYPIHEGDFFGNLFLEKPIAGTCLGARSPDQERAPVLKQRVCTEATDKQADGKKLSRCGMIITGNCAAPDAHSLGGKSFRSIQVFLKP